MDAGRVFLYFMVLRLCAEAQPVKEIEINTRCINITAERSEEIKKITEEINRFINKMADIYEDIDITFTEVHIENHSDQEMEDKETTLKILVNDCINSSHSEYDKYSDSDDYDNEPEHKSTKVKNDEHKSTENNNDERKSTVNNNNEHKSTKVKNYEHKSTDESNDENVSHSYKTSDYKSNNYEYNEKNISNESDESTKNVKKGIKSENTTYEDIEPSENSLINEKSGTNNVDDTDTKGIGNVNNRNVDSKPTITYNFDNSNLYISALKDTPSESGRHYDQLYFELCQTVLGKIRYNSAKKYASRPQRFYENPLGNIFPQDYYDSPNEIDDLWHFLINKLKKDYTNPKNCVYSLKKTCEHKLN